MNLQAQLDSLREFQAAQRIMNSTNFNVTANPNSQKLFSESHYPFAQDVQTWLQSYPLGQSMMPQFNMYLNNSAGADQGVLLKHKNPGFLEEDVSNGSMDSPEAQSNYEKSSIQDSCAEDLQSVAFRYIHRS